MVKHTRVRPLAVAALLGATLLGACTSSGGENEGTGQEPAISGRQGASDQNPVGGRPDPRGQTRAEPAGAIGPGNSAGTSSVNPVTQSTTTHIDSIPRLRPTGGPGSN